MRIIEIWSVGSPTATSTMRRVTSPACGIPAAPILAAVAVILMMMTSARLGSWFTYCAIKMAATASYRAVPSMLMVAPTGSMKRVTLVSAPNFSSRQRIVTGRVAELCE